MADSAFVRAFKEKAKEYLPKEIFDEILRKARASAGGIARAEALRKLKLEEINPKNLKEAPQSEVTNSWRKLNQLLEAARTQNQPIEDIVNAARFVIDEFERRGLEIDKTLPLYREAVSIEKDDELAKTVGSSLTSRMYSLPREVMVVPDFTAIVGSTAKGKEKPNDLDVLIRASQDDGGRHFLIQSENIWLQMRNALSPNKETELQFIDNPQGPHGDNIPLYDLVLRRKGTFDRRILKGFVNGDPESGVHAHALMRNRRMSRIDGAHLHLFAIRTEDGELKTFITEEDGIHKHGLETPGGIKTNEKGSEHPHAITITEDLILEDGTKIKAGTKLNTETDGEHTHSTNMLETTEFNGAHKHFLKLPGGSKIESMNISDFWDAFGPFNLSDVPAMPPASVFTRAIAEILADQTDVEKRKKKKKPYEKADSLKIDIGCGERKADGFIGVDARKMPGVDVVADLNKRFPFDDSSVDEVRAIHSLEHFSDKEHTMKEVFRVLKPGGRLVFEVPSTKGEGAFNHPGHKSFWNKTTFAFWTQDHLLEGRPRFEVDKLEEKSSDDLFYVSGVLRKPKNIEKQDLQPFKKFTLPKPRLEGFTELQEQDIDELWNWASTRLPVTVEPKHNGFRAVVNKKGDKVELWFEGQLGKDQLSKFPDLKESLRGAKGDFILDTDIAIERAGKRLPRPKLQTLNADKPEIEEGDTVVLTIFDMPFLNDDIHKQEFKERRKRLEILFSDELAGKKQLRLSPKRLVNTQGELTGATKWAFGLDRSEGLLAKGGASEYPLTGSTGEWNKLKKVVELKVVVLGKTRTKDGQWNYDVGLTPSDDPDFGPLKDLKGKKFVDLGKTFNTSINASVGDVITIEVLELIPDDEKNELSLLGGRVMDVDRSRKQPFFVSQAVDIAERGDVLQKEMEVPDDVTYALAVLGFMVEKQERISDPEGGDPEVTRGERAEKTFRDNWANWLPSGGKGKFVYHHHWRGLEKTEEVDETKLSNQELFDLGKDSVHGDLRLEGDGGLWGWAVLIGSAKDNDPDDKLIKLSTDKNLRLAPKLQQPKAWLKVARPNPMVVEPGGVGATSMKFSKFFAPDNGEYEMGFAKENAFEIFITKSSKLKKGRYVMQSIPTQEGPSGFRVWNITRPEDQTPIIDRKNLVDEFKDQKKKGRKWIYVAKPGMKPVLIDLKKDSEEMVRQLDEKIKSEIKKERIEKQIPILKLDKKKGIIYGVVLEAESTDTQGDVMTPDEVEKAAHFFQTKSRTIGFKHLGKADGASLVESVVLQPGDVFYGQKFTKVSWVIGVHIPKDLQEKVESKELTAFSVGGFGLREPVN